MAEKLLQIFQMYSQSSFRAILGRKWTRENTQYFLLLQMRKDSDLPFSILLLSSKIFN